MKVKGSSSWNHRCP